MYLPLYLTIPIGFAANPVAREILRADWLWPGLPEQSLRQGW